MIRISNIKINIDNNDQKHILKKVNELFNNKYQIDNYKIVKKSIDARNKNNICYVYTLDINTKYEESILNKYKFAFKTPDEKYIFNITGTNKLNNRPIIIGSGPSGLFLAYVLSENGYKPIIFERGDMIDKRILKVKHFFDTNELDSDTNIQFGEGGAGTFSDGKLNTLKNDKNNRMKKVFETFVECGADESILYESHPHIGTDVLRRVIVNMRNKIIEMGGEFHFNSKLTDINVKNNKVNSIVINNSITYECDNLFLCVGHSARDVYYLLNKINVNMTNKPFAVGIRVIHKQELIDKSLYGASYNKLPHANYKLTCNINSRGVYSFCMCPGGYVINASSDQGHLVINGMSNFKRDSSCANSAIIVTVGPKDYGNNLFDGLNYQEKLEEKCFNACNGLIPVQNYKDYVNNIESKSLSFSPKILGKYDYYDLNKILPDYINNSLKSAFIDFDKKIKGFASSNPILAGIESRTSSPIRILRDDNGECNILGIYPCGEGAGYAGGITTSAMDGIVEAEKFANKYMPFI